MKTNFIEGNCPNCGSKTKEYCNTWVYGTPIRTCESCKSEYLDKRWREVAIDGFDPRSTNASFYLKGTIIFLIMTAVCVASLVFMINIVGSFPTLLLGCIFAGILGTVLCGFLYIRIQFGFETKNNANFMKESELRLQDKTYIQKLIDYGYQFPEEQMK